MSEKNDNTWFYQANDANINRDFEKKIVNPSARNNSELTDELSFFLHERKLENLEEAMFSEIRDAIAAVHIAGRRLYEFAARQLPFDQTGDGREVLPYCLAQEYADPDYLQFSYEGFLPPYFEVNELPKDSLRNKYRGWNKEYYILATRQAITRSKIKRQFNEKTCVILLHFFPNNLTRDLDNRNRKYLIDALKLTGILLEDSWQEVSIVEDAYPDPNRGAHVEMIIGRHRDRIAILEKIEQMYAV